MKPKRGQGIQENINVLIMNGKFPPITTILCQLHLNIASGTTCRLNNNTQAIVARQRRRPFLRNNIHIQTRRQTYSNV